MYFILDIKVHASCSILYSSHVYLLLFFIIIILNLKKIVNLFTAGLPASQKFAKSAYAIPKCLFLFQLFDAFNFTIKFYRCEAEIFKFSSYFWNVQILHCEC